MIFRGLVAEKTDESLFFVDTKQEKSVGKGNLYILHCNTVLRVHIQKGHITLLFFNPTLPRMLKQVLHPPVPQIRIDVIGYLTP